MKEQPRHGDLAAPDVGDPATGQAAPDEWGTWLPGSGASAGQRLRQAGLALLLGLGAALLALVIFAFVADVVLDRESQQFDQRVLVWLHQFSSSQLDLAAMIGSLFGSELVLVISLVLVLWFGAQRRWGAAASLVLIVGGAQLLNDLLKNIVHRTRPTPVGATLLGQAYSFPSGHAMMSMALYTFAAYLGWRLLRGWWRVVWEATMALVVLMVGVSRLYLEVHYPTDVLAGYLAGFIWADAVLIGANLLGRRGARRTQTAQSALSAV